MNVTACSSIAVPSRRARERCSASCTSYTHSRPDNPGQCLADFSAEARIVETFVPRNQFRHYERISRSNAFALYPALADLLVE